MNLLSLALTVANFLSMLSAVPNIREAWKHRDDLKGFSLYGSGMGMTSLWLVECYLVGMGEFLSAIFCFPSALFMTFIFLTLISSRWKNEGH